MASLLLASLVFEFSVDGIIATCFFGVQAPRYHQSMRTGLMKRLVLHYSVNCCGLG